MLSRRDLLMSGAFASRLRPAEAGEQQRGSQAASDAAIEQNLADIRDALRDLRHLTPSLDVTQIQDKQRLHFKVNQKFPNYIEIGLLVWERLSMWHLENHLPLKTARMPDGHMEMEFMFTILILKNELADQMIGNPYD